MLFILIGSKTKLHPINIRNAPTIAIKIELALRFVKGSFRKILAKMKIVAVWLRMLAVDAFVRLIPIIQDDMPKIWRYKEKIFLLHMERIYAINNTLEG